MKIGVKSRATFLVKNPKKLKADFPFSCVQIILGLYYEHKLLQVKIRVPLISINYIFVFIIFSTILIQIYLMDH